MVVNWQYKSRGTLANRGGAGFPYIAASTAFFSGMLGIPPMVSVDRLAAVVAKVPIYAGQPALRSYIYIRA